MHNKLNHPDNTFIVRFWWEKGKEQNAWYGNIHHIQSGITVTFRDKQEMIRFMDQYLHFEKRVRQHSYPPKTDEE